MMTHSGVTIAPSEPFQSCLGLQRLGFDILVATFTRYIYSHTHHFSLSTSRFPRYPSRMSAHQDFVPNNEKYVSSFHEGHLPLPPSKRLVVGDWHAWFHVHILLILIYSRCSDRVRHWFSLWFVKHNISRPASQLGINLGEAHVIRNAGGSAYVLEASQNTPKIDIFLQQPRGIAKHRDFSAFTWHSRSCRFSPHGLWNAYLHQWTPSG